MATMTELRAVSTLIASRPLPMMGWTSGSLETWLADSISGSAGAQAARVPDPGDGHRAGHEQEPDDRRQGVECADAEHQAEKQRDAQEAREHAHAKRPRVEFPAGARKAGQAAR